MRRKVTIWLSIALLSMCVACASQKPEYYPPPQMVKEKPGNLRVALGLHLVSLAMLGWIFHVTNQTSN